LGQMDRFDVQKWGDNNKQHKDCEKNINEGGKVD